MRRTFMIPLMTVALAIPAIAQAAESTVGADQRQSLNITVYTNGQALVQEVRPLPLQTGTNTVIIDDMPDRLRAETALIKSDCGTPYTMRSLAFDTNVIDRRSLLRAYLGQTIGVLRKDLTENTERTVKARVLSAGEPPVLEINGEIYAGVNDPLVFPFRPGDLRSSPALSATLETQGSGPCPSTIAYLTDGLTWQADYTAILTNNDQDLRLIGGATVNNGSGGDFKGVTLKAMAGQVNRTHSAPRAEVMMMAKSAVMADAAPAAPRQSIEGLHRYDLGTNVDLRAGRSIRLPLLSSSMKATIERTFTSSAWTHQVRGAPLLPQHPRVTLTATAPSDTGPLPAGAVRVFRVEGNGQLALAGENNLGNTAERQPFTLGLSEDMDVTIERTQIAFKRISNKTVETSEKLTLHNGKDAAVTTIVRLSFPGQWQIKDSTLPYERESAGTAVWTVSIPPNGSAIVSFDATVIF